ncbi:uncharacterized protein LOC144102352 [Amblyomma americanum]
MFSSIFGRKRAPVEQPTVVQESQQGDFVVFESPAIHTQPLPVQEHPLWIGVLLAIASCFAGPPVHEKEFVIQNITAFHVDPVLHPTPWNFMIRQSAATRTDDSVHDQGTAPPHHQPINDPLVTGAPTGHGGISGMRSRNPFLFIPQLWIGVLLAIASCFAGPPVHEKEFVIQNITAFHVDPVLHPTPWNFMIRQ